MDLFARGFAKMEDQELTKKERKRSADVQNKYIQSMKDDVLYHIGLSSGSQDLKAMFQDVKVSLMCIKIIFLMELIYFFSVCLHGGYSSSYGNVC